MKIEYGIPKPMTGRGGSRSKDFELFESIKPGASIFFDSVKEGRNKCSTLRAYFKKTGKNWKIETMQMSPGLRIWIDERN